MNLRGHIAKTVELFSVVSYGNELRNLPMQKQKKEPLYKIRIYTRYLIAMPYTSKCIFSKEKIFLNLSDTHQ